MPPFESPTPRHRYRISSEKAAITRFFRKRNVPRSTNGRMLLATWDIANLGAQKRSPGALQLIAHILKRFDLIAIQEVNDDFRNFERVLNHMGRDFDFVMSDTAGNNERLVYVYRASKVWPTNLYGELALRARNFPTRIVPVRYRVGGRAKVDRRRTKFTPFDRNPFITSFEAGNVDFTLVNCHLYYGKVENSKHVADRKKYARRVLEVYTLAKWANDRHKKRTSYDRDIVLLGDMNVPAMEKSDPTYRELKRFGWKSVDYVSKTGGSNLGNDKTYDQMTFAPRRAGRRVKNRGVFDFDNAVFAPLWDRLKQELPRERAISRFNQHVKHHISDHRPLWVEVDIT